MKWKKFENKKPSRKLLPKEISKYYWAWIEDHVCENLVYYSNKEKFMDDYGTDWTDRVTHWIEIKGPKKGFRINWLILSFMFLAPYFRICEFFQWLKNKVQKKEKKLINIHYVSMKKKRNKKIKRRN